MRITVKRKPFLDALTACVPLAGGRNLKPVLRNVKVTADSVVRVEATDLDAAIVVGLPVDASDVKQSGECLLPADRLLAIAKTATDEELDIETEGTEATVCGESTQFRLATDDVANYPAPQWEQDRPGHTIAGGDFAEAVRRVVFAASKDSSRYAMNGVLVEADGTTVTLVGTDSKRLAVVEIAGAVSRGEHSTKGKTCIIPTKAVDLFARCVSAESVVTISLTAADCVLTCGDTKVYTRLVEGRYPPYREILPKKATHKINLNAGVTLNAVKQAAIMTSDESKRVKFEFKSNRLTLTAQTAEAGTGEVEVAVPHDGEPVTLQLDPSYVADFLRVLDSEDVTRLDIAKPETPVLFHVGSNYRYLVMPLS